MKDYCPACAMEVEYEGTGHNASCNICGRTKSAAEQTVRSRAEQRRDAKLKWVWIALGVAGAIALFAFYIASGGSERLLATLISTAVQVVLLAVFIWLFLKVKNWLQRRSGGQ